MGAKSSEFDSDGPTNSFVGVLDQFAALRSYSNASGVGGYRVLGPKKSRARRATAKLAPTASALAAIARTRLRLTGSLSVLFIGGLGLAVLAGPATCSCSSELNAAQHASLTRLGYAANADLGGAREEIAPQLELAAQSDLASQPDIPTITVAAVDEPAESVKGVSPITTSALEPTREIAKEKRESFAAVSAGAFPPQIEPLHDAGPGVRVAAAESTESDVGPTAHVAATESAESDVGPPVSLATTESTKSDVGPTVRVAAAESAESDVRPELPAVTDSAPTAKKKIAVADDDDSAPRAKRKKHMRAYRTPADKSEKQDRRPGNEQVVKRAPKWAQQMYVTPWQMQAFSYTR